MFDAFVARHGKPTETTQTNVFFDVADGASYPWESFGKEIGYGGWHRGFLRIGTPELADLHDALETWQGVLPWMESRQIVARNGWGDLILAWHEPSHQNICRVLSGRRLAVEQPDISPNSAMMTVFRHYLTTDKRLPTPSPTHPFLDDELFQTLVDDERAGEPLAATEAFLPLVPYPLGGTHEANNFVVQDLASWYSDMGTALSTKNE